MTALIVAVCVGLAVAHWLLTPLTAALTPLAQLRVLPWLLVGVALWLLAGRPADSR